MDAEVETEKQEEKEQSPRRIRVLRAPPPAERREQDQPGEAGTQNVGGELHGVVPGRWSEGEHEPRECAREPFRGSRLAALGHRDSDPDPGHQPRQSGGDQRGEQVELECDRMNRRDPGREPAQEREDQGPRRGCHPQRVTLPAGSCCRPTR